MATLETKKDVLLQERPVETRAETAAAPRPAYPDAANT